MNRLPIRWQFTLWFGTTLAALLFGFGLLLFGVMRHQLLAETDRGLQEELRELTTEIGMAQSLPELLEQTRRRFTEHGVYDFQMKATSGKVVFQSKSLDGLPTLDPGLTANEPAGPVFDSREVPDLGRCRHVAAKADGPGGPYIVQALTSLKPFEQETSMLLTVLCASGPVALGLGLVGGYSLARRAISPIERIVAVANRITATDLQQRVEVLNPNDELGRLAQTFNALIDRLQKAIEEMRRFTADAAHELRTPLAILRSGVDVTLRAQRSEAEYRHALESAGDEADRLARLADQLLFLSRHDAGMVKMDREEVRLDAVLMDVVEQLTRPADQAGVHLEIEPLEPILVRGDDIRLSRAFYNIIDNAIKYTPRDGYVRIRARTSDSRVRIDVADTGTGIPPEHVPNVFKRFYRVDQSRERERGGAGLGLAIAESAVLAHGGSISIESAVGRGTTVRIDLPLATGEKRRQEPYLDTKTRDTPTA